jgi:hypothetical protein
LRDTSITGTSPRVEKSEMAAARAVLLIVPSRRRNANLHRWGISVGIVVCNLGIVVCGVGIVWCGDSGVGAVCRPGDGAQPCPRQPSPAQQPSPEQRSSSLACLSRRSGASMMSSIEVHWLKTMTFSIGAAGGLLDLHMLFGGGGGGEEGGRRAQSEGANAQGAAAQGRGRRQGRWRVRAGAREGRRSAGGGGREPRRSCLLPPAADSAVREEPASRACDKLRPADSTLRLGSGVTAPAAVARGGGGGQGRRAR